jgi:hypothetical protein
MRDGGRNSAPGTDNVPASGDRFLKTGGAVIGGHHVRQKSKGRMNSFAIASIVLGSSFAAGLVGMKLHLRLPDNHRDERSREAIKLVMGLIASVSALVLSLLVASASSSYGRQSDELRALSANLLMLDQTLALYGPDARSARDGLRDVVRQAHDRIWSRSAIRPEQLNSMATRSDSVTQMARIQNLSPKTDAEQMLKSRALQEEEVLIGGRLLMFEQLDSSFPWPLLAVLIFWLSMLFFGIGLLSRFNGTVGASLFVGALSVAGAIFLILELGTPYQGIMRISDEPLRSAIAQIDR